jgi:hypothetical protein
MKNLSILSIALLLLCATSTNAKTLPVPAQKLPKELKEQIVKQLDYPRQAKAELIEGDVWLKVSVDENSKVKIVDLSATDPQLGEYVKKELSSLQVENPGCSPDQVYYLKVKFHLTR